MMANNHSFKMTAWYQFIFLFWLHKEQLHKKWFGQANSILSHQEIAVTYWVNFQPYKYRPREYIGLNQVSTVPSRSCLQMSYPWYWSIFLHGTGEVLS